MNRPQLLSMTAAEMEEAVGGGFRARQIAEWVRKGADFAEMTNLPKEERFIANPVTIREALVQGETEKYLYALPDGNVIEGVKLKYHYGSSLCVSTQVGCAMGCAFCASTLEGCVRNLTSGEMLGQIVAVNRRLQGAGERLKNAVLMSRWPIMKTPSSSCVYCGNTACPCAGFRFPLAGSRSACARWRRRICR